MIFFDYKKIWLLSGGDSKLIVTYFLLLASKTIPYYPYLKGDDFILKPLVVINNPKRLGYRSLAEYIGLCALRNYANYQVTRQVDLSLDYIPSYIPPIVLKTNPLVHLDEATNTLKFINEEI